MQRYSQSPVLGIFAEKMGIFRWRFGVGFIYDWFVTGDSRLLLAYYPQVVVG